MNAGSERPVSRLVAEPICAQGEGFLPRRSYNHNKMKYGVRSLRPLLRQHTPTTDWIDRALRGDTPRLATRAPIMTPEVAIHGAPRGEALVPIVILNEKGKLAQPLSWHTLRNSYHVRRLKLQFEVKTLAYRDSEAEDWLKSQHLFMDQRSIGNARKSLRILGLGNEERFESICLEGLNNRFPKRNVNRSNMEKKDVSDYLKSQIDIILEMDIASRMQHVMYARLMDFYKGFKKKKARPPENALDRAMMDLPSFVSLEDLIQLSFYGLVDASGIFINHYTLTDILSLASAFGRINFGAFRPNITQAKTYMNLIIKGRESSSSDNRFEYILEAARRLEVVLNLEPYREIIESICQSVIDSRSIMSEEQQERVWVKYRGGVKDAGKEPGAATHIMAGL